MADGCGESRDQGIVPDQVAPRFQRRRIDRDCSRGFRGFGRRRGGFLRGHELDAAIDVRRVDAVDRRDLVDALCVATAFEICAKPHQNQFIDRAFAD